MDTEAAPTITEFLLARIAEDEAMARAAAESTNDRSHVAPDAPFGAAWEALDYGMVRGEGEYNDLWDCEGSETLCTSVEAAAHIARHDPVRILAECAAKRAIIACAEDAHYDREALIAEGAGSAAEAAEMRADAPGKLALHALATVYSDHPDYQQEWAA